MAGGDTRSSGSDGAGATCDRDERASACAAQDGPATARSLAYFISMVLTLVFCFVEAIPARGFLILIAVIVQSAR